MLDEELIPVNEVPSYLPKRRGKSVHIATIYRWIKRGAHGRKLEICRAGGILLTSREALQRFMAGESPASQSAPTRNGRAIEKAESELAAFGI